MACPTENYDSYTNGASTNGLNGGSGWSAAWATDQAPGGVIDNSTSTTSPNSVKFAGASCGDSRTFTAVNTDGSTWYVSMRVDSNSAGDRAYWEPTHLGSAEVFAIRFRDGNVIFNNNSSNDVLVSGFSANTWYNFLVTFNFTNHTSTVAVNGGAPTSALAWRTASSDINNLYLGTNTTATGGNAWIDSMSPTNPITPTTTPLPYRAMLGVGI